MNKSIGYLFQEQHSVIRQLGLCHKANKDAKEHVSIHVCGAVNTL